MPHPKKNLPIGTIRSIEKQLPMTMLRAARALEKPLDHKDPFDELLLVQAQEEG